jgi:hypothetical protein
MVVKNLNAGASMTVYSSSINKGWKIGLWWCFFCLCVCGLQDGFAIQEHWTKGFRNKREFEAPPAFEKIYISRDQILCMQDGIYLKHACGNLEKVRALREDCDGLYVLLIETQCSLCGACYKGKEPPDGMCCPLYEIETRPYIWSKP